MKFEISINAIINETDPSHKRIVEIGIERAVEKFKKELSHNTESLDVSIREILDESGKN
jgi:hypothetical protein